MDFHAHPDIMRFCLGDTCTPFHTPLDAIISSQPPLLLSQNINGIGGRFSSKWKNRRIARVSVPFNLSISLLGKILKEKSFQNHSPNVNNRTGSKSQNGRSRGGLGGRVHVWKGMKTNCSFGLDLSLSSKIQPKRLGILLSLRALSSRSGYKQSANDSDILHGIMLHSTVVDACDISKRSKIFCSLEWNSL